MHSCPDNSADLLAECKPNTDGSANLQATSACACERSWSTYGYIHNKKRNRLAAPRAEKLVFTFSNLRFLKRVQKVGFEEQCWSWDEPEEEEEVQLGEAGEESG